MNESEEEGGEELIKQKKGGLISILDEDKAIELATSSSITPHASFSCSHANTQSSLFGKKYLFGKSGYKTIRSRHNLTEEEFQRLRRIELLQNEWNSIRKQDEEFIQIRIEQKRQKAEDDLIQRINDIDDERSEMYQCKKIYEQNDNYEYKRSEQLCKDWHKDIYEPIQTRISDAITPERFNSMHETRYNVQMKFAQGKSVTLEEKRNLQQTIKTKDLRDPVKSDLYKYDFENKLINGGKLYRSIMKPITKSTLNPTAYERMDHLPFGRDEKILKKLKNKPFPPYTSGGKVITNHYRVDRSQDTVKNQYFRGGRKILRVPGNSTFAFNKL